LIPEGLKLDRELFPVIALFQIEKGLNLFQISINMALYSAAVILFELPTGGLSDTLGRKKVYLISLAVNLSAGVVLVLAKTKQRDGSSFYNPLLSLAQ